MIQLELSSLRGEWLDEARPIVRHWIEQHSGEFTSDDLYDIIVQPPHPNWYGILLAGLSKEGFIERVGFKTSTRSSRNGAVVRVWRKTA